MVVITIRRGRNESNNGNISILGCVLYLVHIRIFYVSNNAKVGLSTRGGMMKVSTTQPEILTGEKWRTVPFDGILNYTKYTDNRLEVMERLRDAL